MRPHILFVDDDAQVLAGLRDSLRRDRERWTLDFAEGGEAALERLGAESPDVVVCDMRMPEVDGFTVLEHARSRRPEAIRFVLTGHVEEAVAVRCVPLAHRFFSKPCLTDRLRGAIEHATRLDSLVPDRTLRAAICSLRLLPSAPSQYARLRAVATQEEERAEAGAGAVAARDPAIAARLLQLVNSSFFSVGRDVASVSEAAASLGGATLRTLVRAPDVFAPGTPYDCGGLDLDELAGRAQRAAAAAAAAAAPSERATAYAAGLLREVGSLVLASVGAIPADATPAERAAAGAFLLGIWGLPQALVEAAAGPASLAAAA